MGNHGTVYGRTEVQRTLYAAVTASARDLRGQLEALTQHAHQQPYDSADVEAVRAALFRAHGWERTCHDLR